MDYWGYFQPCRLSPGACYFEDPILHGIVVHGNNSNLDCTNSILRHICHRLEANKAYKPEKIDELEYKAKESLVGKNSDERGPKMYEYKGSNSLLAGCNMRSSPIPVASSLGSYGSSGRDLYYRSARSLSTSPMSTIGSCAANIQHPCRTSSEMPLLTEDGSLQLLLLLDYMFYNFR